MKSKCLLAVSMILHFLLPRTAIAYIDPNNGQSMVGLLSSFLPLLLIGCMLGFLYRSIAKTKGKSQWLWFFAGFVPFWNILGGLWLVSLPHKDVLDSIKDLADELRQLNSLLRGTQHSSKSTEPQSWSCNCGRANEMNIDNCPECGLKRDYLLK